MTTSTIAGIRALGILSIGVGIFDYLTSETQGRKTGMRDGKLFRLAGAREILTGAGVALFPDQPAPLIARLAGDAGDVAVLATVAAKPDNYRRTAALIGAAMVVAIAVIDGLALAAQRRATR